MSEARPFRLVKTEVQRGWNDRYGAEPRMVRGYEVVVAGEVIGTVWTDGFERENATDRKSKTRFYGGRRVVEQEWGTDVDRRTFSRRIDAVDHIRNVARKS